MREACTRELAIARAGSYLECRRGFEPSRARPPRCEAAPPETESPRAGSEGFLTRLRAASLLFSHRIRQRVGDACWTRELSANSQDSQRIRSHRPAILRLDEHRTPTGRRAYAREHRCPPCAGR